jgi:ArsR family transcriptional regulator, arsenate/arsenite/antimonite-responsive transcriptional repressor
MEEWVQLFKALGDETRLRIVSLLTQGELCVCDLMDVLEEPQSKISRHLSYLKHSGLTYSKRVGVWMHYGLRERANEKCDHLVRFLRGELSALSQSRRDIDRLREFKRKGGCKSDRKATTVYRRKDVSKGSRSSSLSH